MTGVASGDDGLRLALVGHPVAHSLSPAMHDAALVANGLAGSYVAIDTPDEGALDEVLEALVGGRLHGLNVTVPHKQAVANRCARLAPEAAQVGAVNTVVADPAGLLGDNTDTVGFMAALPCDLARGEALVLGAGGAARAVVVALVRAGWSVVVAARRRAQAEEVAAINSGWGVRVVTLDEQAMPLHVRDATLVVNATPLGLAGEPLPDPLMRLHEGQVAYDLVYNPLVTPFLAAAAQAGATTVDGLGMLVGQAAAAWPLWGLPDPDTAVMRQAALDELARRRAERTA